MHTKRSRFPDKPPLHRPAPYDLWPSISESILKQWERRGWEGARGNTPTQSQRRQKGASAIACWVGQRNKRPGQYRKAELPEAAHLRGLCPFPVTPLCYISQLTIGVAQLQEVPRYTNTHGPEMGAVTGAQRRAAICHLCLLATTDRLPDPCLNNIKTGLRGPVFLCVWMVGLEVVVVVWGQYLCSLYSYHCSCKTNNKLLYHVYFSPYDTFSHVENKMSAKGQYRKRELSCFFYWWTVQTL